MVVLRVLFVTENLKVADELQYKKTFLGLDDLEEDVLQTSFGKSLFYNFVRLREKREQNFAPPNL